MSRPIFKLETKEKQRDKQSIETLKAETIDNLAGYLEHFTPKTPGFTKHSIMGPVGKLISKVTSGRMKDKDALLGFVINVHRNTADPKSKRLSEEARNHLETGVEKMLELRERLSTRSWIRVAREIDYGVYRRKYEYILKIGKESDEK